MELPIFTYQGKEVSRKATLDDAIFGIEPNSHAIYLDIKHYHACQRQGTHKTKGRSEVKGSTRKIQKQKGTGNARKGSINSPVLVGGGHTFALKPRDYSFKLNKKQKKLARRSALSEKVKHEQIQILEEFLFASPKTKNYIKLLQDLALRNKKSLLILPKPEKNILLAARNLTQANITHVGRLNTYDLLHADHVMIIESSLPLIHEYLK